MLYRQSAVLYCAILCCTDTVEYCTILFRHCADTVHYCHMLYRHCADIVEYCTMLYRHCTKLYYAVHARFSVCVISKIRIIAKFIN